MDENSEKKSSGLAVIKTGARGALSSIVSKTSDVAKSGSKHAKEGMVLAKKGAEVAGRSISEFAGSVAKSGKEAQMRALQYIDKKKNAKYISIKMSAFEDGIKEGKLETVDFIKKYANFCLATTAVSFFFARCDGEISEEEKLEIQFDLDSIFKNKDLPQEIRNKLSSISQSTNITFDEVSEYLDGVGLETVMEFQKDIDEIILADSVVTEEEKEAKARFDEYLKNRVEAQCNE